MTSELTSVGSVSADGRRCVMTDHRIISTHTEAVEDALAATLRRALSRTAAAAYLGVSGSTLMRLALPSVVVAGRCRRWLVEDLDDYLVGRRMVAAGGDPA